MSHLFVGMPYQTWNLRYYKNIRIISYVGLESFLLYINLDVVSSSNVFSSLIYVFRYKGINYSELMKFQFALSKNIYIKISIHMPKSIDRTFKV